MRFQIPESVTRTVGRQMLVAQKNSPKLLLIGGIAGSVASTVLACRATLRVDDEALKPHKAMMTRIKAAEKPNYTEKDRQHDMTLAYVKTAAKLTKMYAPSLIVGGLSIAMLTKSHDIMSKRNAGLSAAYAALAQGFSEYRGRVIEDQGEEKDREYRFGSETKTIELEDKNGKKKKKVSTFGDGGGSIYSKLFDIYNVNWSQYPEYNIVFLRGVQRQCNDQLRARGHLFLNDVYDALGLDRTPAGSQVGWLYGDKGVDQGVDFGIWQDRDMTRMHDFLVGREEGIMLDFNVDGPIWQNI